jgi:hypothetical protein
MTPTAAVRSLFPISMEILFSIRRKVVGISGAWMAGTRFAVRYLVGCRRCEPVGQVVVPPVYAVGAGPRSLDPDLDDSLSGVTERRC